MSQVDKITPGKWEVLQVVGKSTSELNAMPINVKEHKGLVLIAIDSSDCRHLLVSVNKLDDVRSDSRSPGCRVFARELHGHGSSVFFADLVCLRKDGFDVFNLLANDILERLKVEDLDHGSVCAEALEDWRDLLGGSGTGKGLSASQALGLFGELCVLKQLAQISPISVESWLGPEGNPHDFSQGPNALEVKTTASATSLACQIHGITQLESPVNGNLYLAFLRLVQRPGVGLSLSELISELYSLGVSRSALRTKLKTLGYEENQEDPFLNKKWEVKDQYVWSVRDKFPRLTKDSFNGGNLPDGVLGLNYSIDLLNAGAPMSDSEVQRLFNDLAVQGKIHAT